MSGNYRYASKVRLTMDDPRNENMTEGTVMMLAGKCDEGVAYTVVDEEKEGYTNVECEVLAQYHADERMSEDEIKNFGVAQSKQEVAANV